MAAPDRNALRRLTRILDDDDYGPKLARLRGPDEQTALRLIDENRGAQARRHILEADQRRRTAQRAAARHRAEVRAVDNQTNSHESVGLRVNRTALLMGARLMTDTELRFAGTATRDQLVTRCRQPPKYLTPRGEDWNPYWYH